MTAYRIQNDESNPRLPMLIVEHVASRTQMTAPPPGEEPHYLWAQYQDWRKAGGVPLAKEE